ncbi:MAG: glycosyltransferase [Verrucomicrobiia bacterium]
MAGRFPVNLTNAISATFALLSLALFLWQWLAARRFPLHRRVAESSFAPAVTLLKPLKGSDETTAGSLQSWFNQNYAGPVQILFGVADADDPVCEIARELIRKNPGRDVQLVICGESLGTNGKISTLIQLERWSKYELMLINDADVRVPPDFLANMVAPLRDDQAGLVNCFYRLANPATLAMRWEAVAINADFWSQVLQAASLKPPEFALGAAVLVRRQALTQAGDFNSLANCLADDYQLGRRIAEKGYRIALCPVVVECWNAPMNWRDVWRHQLRWARTIRVCQPLPYFFSILSNATLWPLLWLMVSLISSATPYPAIAGLGLRIFLAQNLQRRFTPERRLVSPFWLVPVKDLLQVALWAGAFLGNKITWRGRQMKLHGDGTLVAQ